MDKDKDITIEHISTITVSKLQSTDLFDVSTFNVEDYNLGILRSGTRAAVVSLEITCVVFHPTELLLATGGRDNNVKLWLLPDGMRLEIKNVASLTGHTDVVNTVAFNSDGSLLATGSSDGTVKLWQVLKRDDGFSAENVATIDMKIGRESSSSGEYSVRSIAFHPTDPLLATGDTDSTVKLWNVNNPSKPRCVVTKKLDSKNLFNWIMSVAFHPTRPFLATGRFDKKATVLYYNNLNPESQEPESQEPESQEPESQEPILDELVTLFGHTEGVCSIVFHPNVGRQKQQGNKDVLLLATGSSDSTAKFWEITDPDEDTIKRTCLLTTEINHGDPTIYSVAFDPLARAYILATGSKILKLCEFQEPDDDNDSDSVTRTICSSVKKNPQITAALAAAVEYNINSRVQSVAFHPTLPFLATGLTNGFVEIYRVTHRSGTMLQPVIHDGYKDSDRNQDSSEGGKSHTRRRTHTRRRSRKQQRQHRSRRNSHGRSRSRGRGRGRR
jgi:WD40 repeat protein